MNNLIAKLAELRAILETTKANRKAMLAKVTDTPEYKDVEGAEKILAASVAMNEELIRQQAVDFWQANEDKHPHPAVTVIEGEEPVYNDTLALAWCLVNLRDAVKIDKKLFEAHAAAIRKTKPIQFVEWKPTQSARIARDLSKYLDEAQATEAEIPF